MIYIVITQNHNWHFADLRAALKKKEVLTKLAIESKLYKELLGTGILIEIA